MTDKVQTCGYMRVNHQLMTQAAVAVVIASDV